ncbi:XRE family transcriptional regulator [Sneathia sp. DSM 16630]|nr:XRE family transcriptional regulator [Sneathia sp. DSM 16630]
MLKNNIELDVKTKCIEVGITQVKLAKEIETSTPYVNRVIRSKETIVNNTLVKMMGVP